MRHALEPTKLALTVACGVVTHSGPAVLVQFVGVGGKGGVHVEGVALGDFKAQAGVQVAPGAYVGCHIVRHAGTQFVYQTDFLVAATVFVRTHLHFQVVGDIHRDASRFAFSRHAVKAVGVGGVFHERHLAVGIRLLITLVIAVVAAAEVGRITETHLWREHVAYGHYLVAEELAPRHEHTIQLGGGRDAEVPVVDVVEAIDGVGHLLLFLCIPVAHDFCGVHAVGKVERGVDVQIVEQREVAADGDVVLHTVAPVACQTGVHQLVFLGADRVAQLSGIAHRNLFIPALLARHLFSLEGVESADVDVQVGQCQGNGRVAHVLVQVHGGAHSHAYARESILHAHR